MSKLLYTTIKDTSVLPKDFRWRLLMKNVEFTFYSWDYDVKYRIADLEDEIRLNIEELNSQV